MSGQPGKSSDGPLKTDLDVGWLDGVFVSLAALVRSRIEELEKDLVPVSLDECAAAFPSHEFGTRLAISDLSPCEAVTIAVALACELQPHVFDEAIARALRSNGEHARVGGVRGKDSRVFLPTAETIMFLCGARSVDDRLNVMAMFETGHRLVRRHLIVLDRPATGDPRWAGLLSVTAEAVEALVPGRGRRAFTGPEFPAERIDTELEWTDLVLDDQTLEQIHELEAWVRHGRSLLDDWGLRRRMRPGYRALFFGPSGTGKTLTASLLGRYTGRDVYRIDLSLVVSKFIGETEKNLSRVFAQAEDRDWILFFDEADALFGKRTQVRDAHDRYANQEVSYLLQRVECFEGLVILASNFRNNIDDAFLRRFQSVIHFPKPTPEQRLRLWRKLLPEQVRLEEKVNLAALCQKHEFTGANVANIVHYACLQAITRGEKELKLTDIQTAIDREYQKEGRVA